MATNIDKRGRFEGAADGLKLGQLVRRERGLVYKALVVAVVLQAIPIGILTVLGEEKKAPKPPVMHLVIRKPRMTKPFELEKRKMPKREMRRQVTAAKPEIVHRPQLRRPDLVGKIKTFRFGVDTGADLGLEVVQPDVQRVAIASGKEP